MSGEILTYGIAGFGVRMAASGRTLRQAEPYRSDSVRVDFEVRGFAEALRAKAPYLSGEDAEYISSGSDFFRKIIPRGAMMLHACAVLADGEAYLFSGRSGVGKTTHAGLWEKYLGEERVRVLNDDKPVLRFDSGSVTACGTPWCGSAGISINAAAPVRGICFLRQGSRNVIRPLSGAEAVHAILGQTLRDVDAADMGYILDMTERLIAGVPLYELECLPDRAAARLSWETMRRMRR